MPAEVSSINNNSTPEGDISNNSAPPEVSSINNDSTPKGDSTDKSDSPEGNCTDKSDSPEGDITNNGAPLEVSSINNNSEPTKDDKINNYDKTKHVYNKQFKILEHEKIEAKSVGVKHAIVLTEDEIINIDSLKRRNNELEMTIKVLRNKIEELDQKCILPVGVKQQQINDIKDNFMAQIPSLNELLNSEVDKITVYINIELLIKATKFVDSHSLIRLESLIREKYDLNSTIVQSILLAFIHQNSLL